MRKEQPLSAGRQLRIAREELESFAEVVTRLPEAQGRVEGSPPTPGEGGERLREIVLRREARRRGDAPSNT